MQENGSSRPAAPTRPGLGKSVRGAWNAGVFLVKVFPMLPSRAVNWVTPRPVRETVRYPTCHGEAEGDLYHPDTAGPHPGIVVCLGVVPFGVEHPQVAVLGNALARAGFAALLYWSPAMRDFHLDPDDIESLALAYQWLIERPDVDERRSGLLGTCVGGSFALMAAAHPAVRQRVAFASAYAPYSSMDTFARDIASATRIGDHGREPWAVDPLTRKVFVHGLTAMLDEAEAGRLRAAYAGRGSPGVEGELSAEGQAVETLLSALEVEQAEETLRRLPGGLCAALDSISPVRYIAGLRAPLIVLLHDRQDSVIPVSESRRLVAALGGRAGVQYTEMNFQHLDPTKGRLPPQKLLREFLRFVRAVYPIFRMAA